jgi:hypothetical protein
MNFSKSGFFSLKLSQKDFRGTTGFLTTSLRVGAACNSIGKSGFSGLISGTSSFVTGIVSLANSGFTGSNVF